MDAGVAAVLAALITATGAVVAAVVAAVMSRHRQPDTSTNLPPLPPLEPYKSAGPSRTASTATLSPEPWTAPGVIGAHDATIKYAGFWIRLLAGLIDVTLVCMLTTVAVGIFAAIRFGYFGLFVEPLYFFIVVAHLVNYAGDSVTLRLAFLGVAFFYILILFSAGSWQATLGKLICGLRIMGADGGRATPLLVLKRFLSYFVSALPVGLGFLMIGMDDQKRALHDRICDTRVIYTSKGRRLWSRILGR